MRKGMEFEASITSGITPDVAFIREHDEIIARAGQFRKNGPALLVFLTAALIFFYFYNKMYMVCASLLTVLLLIFYVRRMKLTRRLMSDDFMRMIYEEGLLVPGIIIKTEPLTIMAVANLTVEEGVPVRNACYVMEVGRLPGAEGKLYEKIPCSCMFRYEKGSYHSAFQPHPLYWGTQNQEEIGAAIRRLDESQSQNTADEWEILKKLSAEFPDLQTNEMLLTDEWYQPLGKKHYREDEFKPL